ncbi:TonB-dependent receptor [Luteimonas saliphila]|uniref:TonB-dependent receptor n=1 Tax=Luteimonas saliphila TaxID=2804919 RepID=UPI00192E0D80|nr:TonB-dependent receptor [Luteimonas saliphila]
MGKNTLRVAILNAILLAGGTLAYPETAFAQSQAQTYSIAAGDLESVLSRFGTESRIQLIYPPELLKGKRSSGLTGNFAPMEALRQLLQGSGLEAERVNDRTVVIKKAAAPAVEPQAAPKNIPKTTQAKEPEVKELDTMTITGTRIRGGISASPTIVIGEQRFQEEGFTDLGEVIRSLPQNFKGGQNPGALATSASLGNVANDNQTGGSGLNLRGLGPDATLTLLNGRRMAYGGSAQSVDISAIPIEAVDRIEIVPDGASAIYGSDAVAGVGNVILKRDFDGVTVGTRYGDTAKGGMTTREYTVTAGAAWSSGGVIATYKDASVDPIYADQRDYAANLPNPYSIYPGSDARSGLVSVHQSFGDFFEFRLDALRTERDQVYDAGYTTMYYHYTPRTTTSLVSPTVDFMMPNGWLFSLGATWGKDETQNNADMVTIPEGVSTPMIRTGYGNESRSYEFGAEGPLFALGGGDARLALGAGYRTNRLLINIQQTGMIAADGDESSRFAYAEMNLPLIGSDTGTSAGQRLTMTAAVRGEDYDSFGSVITPKLGLVYGPSMDVTLKASWGRSFKAPTLNQRYSLQAAYLDLPEYYGGTGYPADATVLSTGGGNPDLGPERARTLTASLAFHPEALPGLETELTWFEIDYTDRVVMPIGNSAEALSNPIYSEFVIYSPTPDQLAEAISRSVFYNYVEAPYDPEKVVAMFFNTYVNASRQRIRGIDLSASYRQDLGDGRLTLSGSASWLDSSQKTTSSQSSHDLSGSIYNPAEINARIGAVWSQGGFTVSTFANYTDGVRENFWSAGTVEKTASFTTFDANLQYQIGEQAGIWSNLEFSLSAQNLFDRDPSLFSYTSEFVPRYDATNTSVMGRYLSVSVSKHW